MKQSSDRRYSILALVLDLYLSLEHLYLYLDLRTWSMSDKIP